LMHITKSITDGTNAVKQMKELKPSMPVVAVSTYAIDNEHSHELFDEIIMKPLLSDRLIQIVEKYLWDKLDEA
jgi:two-component SAPR family response regulator